MLTATLGSLYGPSREQPREPLCAHGLGEPGGRSSSRQVEVEEAFWIPLSSLRSAGPSAVVRRVIRGERREWPAYPSPAGPIWGITERILTGFLALAAGARV